VRISDTAHAVAPRRGVGIALKLLLLGFVILYAFFPIAWVASAALNPANTLINQNLIPPNATLDNFRRLFDEGMATEVHPFRPFALWIWNSIKVSTISSILIVGLTALAAYSFSRFRYRYRRQALLTILLVQLFPNLLAIVSLFLLLQLLGSVVPWLGLNTHGGLIAIYAGGALGFNTWLMKGYFDTIPRSLDESALVDGATRLQIFRYILVPLIRPILVVIGLLTFIGTYSDFILARTLLKSSDEYTFAVGLTFFIRGQYQQEWGAFAAAALIGAIPIVILFFFLQRQLIGGLTAGAVKG
jgi:arabinogalactan oligomer/maltooligosaccharide transport system permease protein